MNKSDHGWKLLDTWTLGVREMWVFAGNFAGMFKKEKEEYLKKKKVISHELAIFPAQQFVVSCM